tara:strand:- start:3365 stop:5059 length:1695 start_codon:yes stop_codon:yes gene_type:complete
MCGFYFKITKDVNEFDKTNFNFIRDSLTTRGSDQQHILKGSIGIYKYVAIHSRLIISGNSAYGIQPVKDEDDLLLFNGQIYNHKFLEQENLIEQHLSDTDFLFSFIKDNNPVSACEFLKGPFAIIYLDIKNKSLFISRDVFGESPLFLTQNENEIIISSDRKLLDIDSLSKKKLLEESFSSLSMGFSLANYSINSIFLPGCFYTFSLDRESITDPEIVLSETRQKILSRKCKSNILNIPTKDNLTKFIDSFLSSLSLCTLDYKTYGLLLSTGIDSNFLDVSLDQLNIAHSNYSIVTSREKNFPFNSSQIVVAPVDYVKDLILISKKSCNGFFDLATPLVMSIMRQAKEKILISGDGADEIFLGYKKYKLASILDIIRNLNPYIQIPLLTLIKYLFNSKLNFDIKKEIKSYPWKILIKGQSNHEIESAIEKIENASFNYDLLSKTNQNDFIYLLPEVFLRKGDFASLISGKQLRLPYLSKDLFHLSIDGSLPLINNVPLLFRQKSILYNAYKHLTGKRFKSSKAGFGMSNTWISNAITDYIDKSLCSDIYEKKYLQAILRNRFTY